MTNSSHYHSYNFGDTFGDPVGDSIPADALVEARGSWCNQADGIFEQDDAIRAHGGLAYTS